MKIIVRTPERLTEALSRIEAMSLPLEVSVRPYKENRSVRQNALLHKWFTFISREYAESTGIYHRMEAWKEYYKQRYGVYEDIEICGEVKRIYKSTAKYTTKEMSEFLDNINHHAGSELNIFVPLPGLGDYDESI